MIFFDIDTQRDFLDQDGALSVPDSEAILSNLERLLTTAGEQRITTISSGCAHQPGDPEFQMFPPHCLEGTRGAERVFAALPALPRREIAVEAQPELAIQLESGTHYLVKKIVFDLFSNPWLEAMRRNNAFRQEVCVVFGVATDYCVRAAALGLVEAGAIVWLVEDAVRGVAPDTTTKTIAEMRAAGVVFTNTDEVIRMAATNIQRTAR